MSDNTEADVARFKGHPDYSEGFLDATEGEALPTDATEPYAAGWHAAHRVKALFRDHGFTEVSSGEFSIKLPVE